MSRVPITLLPVRPRLNPAQLIQNLMAGGISLICLANPSHRLLLLDSSLKRQSIPTETCSPSMCLQLPLENLFGTNLLHSRLLRLQRFYLSWAYPCFTSLYEDLLHTLLAEKLQIRLSIGTLRSCALLQQKSFNYLLRIATLILRPACACLAWLWCQIFTSEMIRNNNLL